MSEKLKEEGVQQKSNGEEINQLNSLKDEEYLKKLNETSHLQKQIIVSDPNLTSNKEINQLNSLKDEEYIKKLNETSHLQKEIIVSDPNLTSNKGINCSLSNEWNTAKFPDFLVNFSTQNKTTFPIDKYLNNQSEDNIFYQHPNLINKEENDTFILNSFRELEVDLMNKWFENYEYFDYYLSLYNQELFLNEERKLENIDKLKEKIKINLEKEIK